MSLGNSCCRACFCSCELACLSSGMYRYFLLPFTSLDEAIAVILSFKQRGLNVAQSLQYDFRDRCRKFSIEFWSDCDCLIFYSQALGLFEQLLLLFFYGGGCFIDRLSEPWELCQLGFIVSI